MRIKVKETGTFPLIIHGNGKGDRMDDGAFKLIKEYHKNETFENSYKDDITIVSWKGGKLEGKTTLLEESVAKHGYKVLNLPWISKHGFWKDSQQKITTTLQAIRDGKINTKYVMWMDNSDVMFLDSPSVILDEYLKLGTAFAWNGEKNNYPRPDLPKWKDAKVPSSLAKLIQQTSDYDNTFPNTYKFMNSGAGVGETGMLLDMLIRANELIEGNGMNDQAVMRVVQNEFKDYTMVDRNCELFLCCWGVTKGEVEIL